MDSKNKNVISIIITLLLISIILPMGISIFSDSSELIAPCQRTNVLGSAFYNNKTQTELITTQDDFNLTTSYSLSDSADVYIDFTEGIQNVTDIIEDGTPTNSENCRTYIHASSFMIPADSYLQFVNCSFVKGSGTSGEMYLLLLNSTWDGSKSKPWDIGDLTNHEAIVTAHIGHILDISANGWFSSNIVNYFLDNSLTENNTWFIALWEDKALANSKWEYVTDGVDSSDVYSENDAYGWDSEDKDFLMKVNYSYDSGTLSVNSTEITTPDTYHFDYNVSSVVNFVVNYTGVDDIDFLVTLNLYAQDDEFNLYSELDSVSINLTILELYDDCSLYLNITNLSNMSELIEFNLTIDGVLLLDYDINDLLIVSNITSNTSIYMDISSNIGSGYIDFSVIAYYYCCSAVRESVYDIWNLVPIFLGIGVILAFISIIKYKKEF